MRSEELYYIFYTLTLTLTMKPKADNGQLSTDNGHYIKFILCIYKWDWWSHY